MTQHPTFAVRDGWLQITSEAGAVLAVRPDDLAVIRVLQLDLSGAILLLDPPTGTGRVQNLLKVTPDGAVAWRAELPPGSGPTDAFVSFNATDDGRLVASTWSGYRMIIDEASGRVHGLHFAK